MGSGRDWRAVVDAYNEIDRLNWVVLDAVDEEGWSGQQTGAPWEGPALVPAAELQRVLGLIDEAVARVAALESRGGR
jgi:hypothetical protein